MSKVAIEVFNIGKTVVNRDEVARWLEFLGVPDFNVPEATEVTNPALLVALAAKRCYKSFDPSLNPNLTRVRSDWADYLDNVLNSGHGSVLEHSVFNFAIENVSRVFTGEMNRHRAGWAISEGSMRFIRFGEEVPYWEPESIKGPDVLEFGDLQLFFHGIQDGTFSFDTVNEKKHLSRAIFERAFEQMRQAYRSLEAVWKDELSPESKFAQKKQITSMMRRVIGMGVATGGVWSGNVRALRHVLTMRCEPAAEEEILHVFTRVAKQMKDQEPMLFGDFHQDEQGFWRPKYRKV